MYPGVHARTRPERLAWVMEPAGGSITYSELDHRSNRVAHLLDRLRLPSQGTVAVVAENRLEWAELMWGVARSGRDLAPVNWHLGRQATFAALAGSQAGVVIASPLTCSSVMAVLGDLPGRPELVVLGDDYEARLAAEPPEPVDGESLGGRVMFSSGTTSGRPKVIRHPGPGGHPATAAPHLGGYTRLFRFEPDTVYLSPAPTYHTAPFRFTFAITQLGGTVVNLQRFDPSLTLTAMARHRVTHAQFVPTMLLRLLRLPADVREAADTSSLQVAITGAAPCPVPLKQAITDWWGPVVHELYGASESYGNCHIGPEEAAARPGSVGRALSGTIHVTDEAGVELPGGQTGTIWFEGTTPFRYDGDEHTPRHPKGWITVGDRGHLDADGYLYLSGRRDHLVISGGVNVSPQAAEDVLAVHPAVEDVAVLGEPDPDLGERLVAVVVPHPSQEPGTALAAELVAACRAALSKAETPARVDFVEALPRAENGKLYKSLLQHRYQGDNKG